MSKNKKGKKGSKQHTVLGSPRLGRITRGLGTVWNDFNQGMDDEFQTRLVNNFAQSVLGSVGMGQTYLDAIVGKLNAKIDPFVHDGTIAMTATSMKDMEERLADAQNERRARKTRLEYDDAWLRAHVIKAEHDSGHDLREFDIDEFAPYGECPECDAERKRLLTTKRAPVDRRMVSKPAPFTMSYEKYVDEVSFSEGIDLIYSSDRGGLGTIVEDWLESSLHDEVVRYMLEESEDKHRVNYRFFTALQTVCECTGVGNAYNPGMEGSSEWWAEEYARRTQAQLDEVHETADLEHAEFEAVEHAEVTEYGKRQPVARELELMTTLDDLTDLSVMEWPPYMVEAMERFAASFGNNIGAGRNISK